MRRTYKNGGRYEPLSIEEIKALQDASPLEIHVKMLHGDERISIQCDPATIAEDVCKEIIRRKNIQSPFGWSIFIENKSEVKSFSS